MDPVPRPLFYAFFFSSRRRHTRYWRDWSPDVCSSDLRFEGYTPVELTGRVEFPQIGVLPYMLTLAGHGFYWFELAKPQEEPEPVVEDAGETSSPVADSLLAAGVVSDAEQIPGGSDTRTGDDVPSSTGGTR